MRDYYSESYTTVRKCPHCEKTYKVTEIPQTPGFRGLEEEICPNCKQVIRKSLEYEFYTEKYEDNTEKH